MQTRALLMTTTLVALALSGCTGTEVINQAGSSTVLPLAERWAEEFGAEHDVQINVAGGGSGKGASGLCAQEHQLGDMSRPMKDSERQECLANGVDPVEWTIAFDGLSVVVAHGNSFVDDLSVEQLTHIFRAQGPAMFWDEVVPAIPGAPHTPVHLCYPDSDSGTYEYFNEAVLDSGEPRTGSGVQQSPNDNILVTCLANDDNAIGYFGFAYYAENQDKVKLVAVEGVKPSQQTVADKSYTPLGRPIFIYTDGVPADGTMLHAYLQYVLTDGQAIVPDVGYVALDAGTKQSMLDRLG